jgi:uncharacterized coiled-coil protein SlyX
VTSALPGEQVVTVEHPRQDGTTLVDTPEPMWEQGGSARWEVRVPATGEAGLTIRQRRAVYVNESVDGLSPQRVAEWRRAGLLAPESAAVLDRLLDLQRQVAEAEAAERDAYADRGRALERQEQLGKALAPLGTTGREAELRERYVTELGSLEDRLAELDRMAAEARAEAERRREEIRALLG